MALGTNRASTSRKTDLIIQIQLKKHSQGMYDPTMWHEEACDDARRLRRMKVEEILDELISLREETE